MREELTVFSGSGHYINAKRALNLGSVEVPFLTPHMLSQPIPS